VIGPCGVGRSSPFDLVGWSPYRQATFAMVESAATGPIRLDP
jgi:hypothetical protein